MVRAVVRRKSQVSNIGCTVYARCFFYVCVIMFICCMAYVTARLWGEGLVWLIGVMVCLLVAPWVQLSVSEGNGWSRNALRHHWLMPISCHFRDCKALLVTSLMLNPYLSPKPSTYVPKLDFSTENA